MVTLGTALAGIGPLKIATILIASCLSFLILTNLGAFSSRGPLRPNTIQNGQTTTQSQPEILKEPSRPGYSHSKTTIQDIKNDTLGFEKILVLNLPERSDKRDAMVLASSLSNMTVTFVEGIKGEAVIDKALPWGQDERKMPEPMLGSWRAHMNAIRSIVENGWSSAIIMEDDVDWDIHLKAQLLDYAHGSRFLQNQTIDEETHSPYGDGWDVLWFGHCHDNIDKQDGRTYVIQNDPTVPANAKLTINNHDFLAQWPDHSRIVHVAGSPICTFAYALSYRGAQKLLFALSVKELRGFFDNALSWWCSDKGQNGRCLSAHPPYFAQHKVRGKAGKNSDNQPNQPGVDKASTINIRFSTRLNLEQLLTGSTNWHDSYPREPEQPKKKDDSRPVPKAPKVS